MPKGKKDLASITQRRVNNLELLIFQAAKLGRTRDLEFVLELPKADKGINYQDQYGHTPLMIAAKNGHLGCVKVLLGRGADLKLTTHRGGQEVTVWQLAKKAGHTDVSSYLQKCQADLKKIGRTRANIESVVERIASSAHCSGEELHGFTSNLELLITHCDYELNGHNSQDGDTHTPLLIRATKAGNVQVFLKLLHEFKATPLINELETGHNILHVACLHCSDLRYYIVKRYPHLLRNPDSKGAVPLHLACANNDIEFVRWLFGKILSEESEMDNLCVSSQGGLKRSNSLPDIPKGRAVRSSNSRSSIRRKPSGQSEITTPSNTPVNLLSPVASLPVFTPTHRRVISGGNVMDIISDNSSNSRESSPFDLREAGLIFSFDSTSTRSNTVSLSSGRSRTNSMSSSTQPSSIENSSESRGLKESMESRGWRESSEPKSEGEELRDETTPLPPVDGHMTNGDSSTCLLGLTGILCEPPLTVNEILDMRPFRVDTQGSTILHILAHNGHSELLGVVLKVADYIKRSVDFKLLTHRDCSRLPIEEAIQAKSIECVRLLVHFTILSGLFDELLADTLILKTAVFTSDIEVVKVLLEFGFTSGLGPAIALAMVNEYHTILRLLLFYHTQVVNSTEYSHVLRTRQVTLDKGGIDWDGLQLDHLDSVWLYDSYDAVDSVSRALDLDTIFVTPEGNNAFYSQLGQDCLRYFNERVSSPTHSLPSRQLTQITEINISSNLLTQVPNQLFQMPSLLTLKLSQNQLASLPTSNDLYKAIYTSPIQRLDLDWNTLESLPEDLFRGVANSLEELNVECNHLRDLPPGMWVCPKLKVVKLARNKLSRLHTLSDPRYFVDLELSKQVTGSFTAEEGQLKCTMTHESAEKLKDLAMSEKYLRQLTSYYLTVSAAQKSNAAVADRDIYQEVISMHLARMLYYRHPEEGTEGTECQSYRNSQLLLPGEVEDEADIKSISRLETLDLSMNRFKQVPWDLVCVAPHLNKLELTGNSLTDLDLVHSMPLGIKSVVLNNNQIVNLERKRSMSLPCGDPLRLLTLPEDNYGNCYCRHCKHEVLNNLTNLSLEHNRLDSFPVVDLIADNTNDPELQVAFDIGTISYLVYYPNLSILALDHNQFSSVPQHLHRLTHLSSLSLSYNNIRELPPEMGLINSQQLLLLKMEGLFLKNIPDNLLNRPTPKHLLSYLKAMQQKSKPYRRIKLMVVGGANKGKTSLLLNLTKKGRINRMKDVVMSVNNLPLSTVGVDLGDWEYTPNPRVKPKVTFMTWDFGGQAEYYATHQCFLTKRSLYILVWDLQDDEKGLNSLRPWLENIEGRAPKSPVFVIATHVDKLSPDTKSEKIARVKQKFQELYINYSNSVYMYPNIYPQCFFVNCYDNRHMDNLRDFIYDYVTKYKAPAPKHLIAEMDPLLEQPIPASYMVLEDIVRSLAEDCRDQERNPIFTKQEFITAVKDHEAGYYEKLEELEQATMFLHDNGILLHYEDSSLLSDLYFLDPQWLCSMLAKVVTVQEKNPYQRNGFMPVDNLHRIFPSFVHEFIMLMQKFEVVLLLDSRRMLIPSLLPVAEEDSIVVFLRSVSETLLDKKLSRPHSTDEEEDPVLGTEQIPHAPLCQTPYPLISRYYFLPFVPNGFFTRVIARLISTEIMDHLYSSLHKSQLEEDHLLNAAHWRCWRDGISIIWNHMEIFHIAPVTYPLLGTQSTVLLSNSGQQLVQTERGVEIKVAVLPEESVTTCSMIPNIDSAQECSKGRCIATWLLHQAVTVIDSVFEDWYEVFSKKKGFELSTISTGSPCKRCYQSVQTAEVKATATPLQRRLSTFSMSFDVIQRWSMDDKPLYLFSCTYCSLALDEGVELTCPAHGQSRVAEVAPDLMFSDFPSCKVYPDPSVVVLKRALGDGGFGTVFKASLTQGSEVVHVAVKQFRSDMAFVEQDPKALAELKCWDMYQKASQEARVMLPLCHPNILGLIGLTFQPVRLLVELAPCGDLKNCVRRFKKAKVRLSRSTLQQTLTQTAEALKYLHSKRFIYRDLKPDNVLVWQYPTPESQWSSQANVFIKIADYGISKQVTPQGIRGVEGTRPYLAPEVILHGGREAYSTMMDVYAFGMFMYYLTTFMSPFEGESRPITALLEEGRRPEMSAKLRPRSLRMFELMCWCWSDLPQHRPNFEQILTVLKTDTFTDLLAATSITKNTLEITASSMQTTYTRRSSVSSYHGRSSVFASGTVDLSMTFTGAMSLIIGSPGEEMTTQVWYGTDKGTCGLIQFQRSGTHQEDIELPFKKKKYISNMTVVNKNVWICTVGAGLWVYNTDNRQPVATWGEEEKRQIYALLDVPDVSSVLALTHKGMFVFESDLGSTPAVPITLYPTHTIPRSGITDLNEGIVIPSGCGLKDAEVWVCSQSVLGFCILDPKDFSVIEEVKRSTADHQSHKIRHMTTVVLSGRRALLVADRHVIQFWDVVSREMERTFCCMTTCKPVYGENPRSSRVTSLLSGGDFLYIGTGGGIILVLDTVTLTPHKLLHAYSKPVRSLLMVQPNSHSPPVFQRLFSRKDSNHSNKSITSRQSSRLGSSNSMQSSLDEGLGSDRAVLITLGVAYRGVTEGADNHHSVFLLPSDGAKTNTKLANYPKQYGHLLLWSADTCNCSKLTNGITDDTEEVGRVNLPNLCEVDEEQCHTTGTT